MRGSENALLALLRGMDRRKIIPLLYTGNPNLVDAAKAEGVRTELHPMPEIMIEEKSLRLQFGLWARTLARMLALIRKQNIGLIYCNGGSTCQVGYYAAKLSGIPVIAHLHSPYNRRYILLYRLHLASEVIFVSSAIEKQIRGKHHFRARCEVVHNGVNTERFRPPEQRDESLRGRLSIPPNAVVFGQVSSLIHRKGIDILLRAFQLVSLRYPEARLVLVGDGPERSEFVTLATDLGVAHKVVWAGDQADPIPFYQHVFDVNVLASRSDAMPISILEGASSQLPTLGANVDGIPEAILDGQTGLLFEKGNHEMLAERMAALVCNSDLRRNLGMAGRTLMFDCFSMEKYCRTIENIILSQVERTPMVLSGNNYAY